jgi:hypothetical protein
VVGLVPALDDGIEAEGAALAGSAARSVTATTMALRKSVAADCCSGWTAGFGEPVDLFGSCGSGKNTLAASANRRQVRRIRLNGGSAVAL